MDNKTRGLFSIILGFFFLILAGQVIVRIGLAIFGVYLIINGLQMRNQYGQFFSYGQLFSSRRPPF